MKNSIDPKLEDLLKKLKEEPSVANLRKLHLKLTKSVRRAKKGELLNIIIPKLLTEAILENALGNGYVDASLEGAIKNFANFFHQFLYQDFEEKRNLSEAFGNFIKSKQVPIEKLIKLPDGRAFLLSIWDLEEKYSNINFDTNFSYPAIAKKVSNWYLTKIKEFVERYSSFGIKLNSLLFIEKPYSSIGALMLSSYLVSNLNMPATILKIKNIDKRTKLVGDYPTPLNNYCIVYDTITSGMEIKEAIKFLKRNYGADCLCAVAFFEFDKSRDLKDLKKNINLESYIKYSEIENLLGEIKYNFIRRKWPIPH